MDVTNYLFLLLFIILIPKIFNNMYRKFFLIIIITLIPLFSYAQPKLKIEPDKIEFKSPFDRLKNLLFINEGTDTLSIDSVYYGNYNIYFNFYFLRFDVNSRFPIKIAPNDTIKMDCILTNYYYIPSEDTSDNMLIYSDGTSPVMNIKINIGYSEDTGGWGTILGNITANKLPANNAEVYIIHNGTRIGKSISTDASGFFSVKVPNGLYTVAAEKDSFYTTFFGQSFSPYSSRTIYLKKDDIADVNIDLPVMTKTGFSICGQLMDSLSMTLLKRAIIIASKGRHTPSKFNAFLNDSLPVNSYSAIINSDGTYHINNIMEPGYYIIQSFSDYYVPSYYKSNDLSSPFWEKADSVYINGDICDLNILMPRDSSFGDGKISGLVTMSPGTGSNFSDVIVFAQSVESYHIFNHSAVEDNGSFIINDLPYGRYRIIAQKVGYARVYSNELTIDSSNTEIDNIEINFEVAGVSKEKLLPNLPVLYQNYPNPFNPSTSIEFFIPSGSNTALKIFNILGEEIKTIYNGYLSAGNHKFNFNAADYSSGIYFVILDTDGSHLVKKIVLMK